jgi:hypothetical protein
VDGSCSHIQTQLWNECECEVHQGEIGHVDIF